jgi:hypothetical protein
MVSLEIDSIPRLLYHCHLSLVLELLKKQQVIFWFAYLRFFIRIPYTELNGTI